MAYGQLEASRYESEAEHQLVEGEAELWQSALAKFGIGMAGQRVLDVGAGTGLFSRLVAERGCHVTALEPSLAMIEEGRARCAAVAASGHRVAFVHGDTLDGAAFPAHGFDWIVSRQTLCHLTSVDEVVANWRRWLRPGGGLFLTDGFWPREAWSHDELCAQPFAAVKDLSDLCLWLANASFEIDCAEEMMELNALRERRFDKSCRRYLLVAYAKPGDAVRR